MPEYLDDPSVLTKERLKSELAAHHVELPGAGATKDVYVRLYLENLTARNARTEPPAAAATALNNDDGGGGWGGFSSDEDLPPPVVRNASRSSGRKAIRKTDKTVQSETLDVAELTAEGLKDELLKYGVDAGPIVASTRRVYEKKLLRLLDESASAASPEVPPTQTEGAAVNHNGQPDSDQFSDKEEEEERVVPEPVPEVIPEPEPLPEPIPLVERLVRSRGKTPVTTRTRSSQHNKIGPQNNNACSVPLADRPQPRPKTGPAPSPSRTAQYQLTRPPVEPPPPGRAPPPPLDQATTWVQSPSIKPVSVPPTTTTTPLPRPGSLNQGRFTAPEPPVVHTMSAETDRTNAPVARGEQQKVSPFPSDLSPIRRHGCVSVMPRDPSFHKVEKVVVVEQTQRAQERDILKEVFSNDINSPTGIMASCRKPIRGAAGRPLQPSDFWNAENLLLSPKSIITATSSTTSTYSETRHRSAHLAPATPSFSAAASSSSSSSSPPSPASSSSASRLLSQAAPPAGQTGEAHRGLSIWLKLFVLVLLVSFLFFVYQTMEANVLGPFVGNSAPEQVAADAAA